MRLGVEHPALFTGIRIQRDDFAGRCAGVDGVADLDRRVLVFRRAFGDFTGAIGPRHLQLIDIVFGDLIQCRVAGARRVATVVAPVHDTFLRGVSSQLGNR